MPPPMMELWLTIASNIPCHYSSPIRIGKPRGSKNKKTIEKLNALAKIGNDETNRQQQECQSGRGDDNGAHIHESAPAMRSPQLTQHSDASLQVSSSDFPMVEASNGDLESNIFTDFPDMIDANTIFSPPQESINNEEMEALYRLNSPPQESLKHGFSDSLNLDGPFSLLPVAEGRSDLPALRT